MSTDAVYAATTWPKNVEGKNAKASSELAQLMVDRFIAGVMSDATEPTDIQFYGDPDIEENWQQDIVDRYRQIVFELFEDDYGLRGVGTLYFPGDLCALVTTEDSGSVFEAIEIVRNLGITEQPVEV